MSILTKIFDKIFPSARASENSTIPKPTPSTISPTESGEAKQTNNVQLS